MNNAIPEKITANGTAIDIEKIDYVCTTDDRFIKQAVKIKNLKTRIVSPIKFVEEYEKWV